MCPAQGHNTATRVGLEPPTSGSGVRGVNHQATAPPSYGMRTKYRDFWKSSGMQVSQLICVLEQTYDHSLFLERKNEENKLPVQIFVLQHRTVELVGRELHDCI